MAFFLKSCHRGEEVSSASSGLERLWIQHGMSFSRTGFSRIIPYNQKKNKLTTPKKAEN